MILAALQWGSVLAPLVKPAIRITKQVMQKNAAKYAKAVAASSAKRAVGSNITKGPLKLGKTVLIGPARPGIGGVTTAAGAVAGAAAVLAMRRGVGTFSPARAAAPRTQSRPQPQRAPTPRKTATRSKLCCPAGTIRKVCFKRKVSARKLIAQTKRKAATARKPRKRRS